MPNETKATNTFFCETNASISCIPMRTIHFSWLLMKKKIDSIHGWSSSCFKAKLWFQTKRRLQMLFSRNQRINIVYHNENYPFTLAPHEKKLDSIHRRSSSCLKHKFYSKQNKGYKCFFLKTNASILCIPIRTNHLSWPLVKRN